MLLKIIFEIFSLGGEAFFAALKMALKKNHESYLQRKPPIIKMGMMFIVSPTM